MTIFKITRKLALMLNISSYIGIFLFFSIFEEIFNQMLTKDKVRKTIDRLPENFTVDQIVEELVILDKIGAGLNDIEEGRVFSTDQVKQELKTWLK